MKVKTISILLFSTLLNPVFAQKIDLENAPLNPIAFQFKREHFNLKGAVSRWDNLYFNEDGYLIKNSTGNCTYKYVNGKLVSDNKGNKYTVNSKDYIIGVIDKYGDTTDYKYNAEGLLIYEGDKYENKTYTYDSKNRLIRKNEGGSEKVQFEGSDYGVRYNYFGTPDDLEVFYRWDADGKPTKSKYANGHLNYSSFSELEIRQYKFDDYGNVYKIIISDGSNETVYNQKLEYFEQVADHVGFAVIESRLRKPRVEKTIEETIEPEKTYFSDGTLLSESFYDTSDSGILKVYHRNGALHEKYMYKNGRPYNLLECYDKNGNALDKGTFKNGNGYLYLYDEDGGRLSRLVYKNSQLEIRGY
ncbi:toxin-antitoxin system YwqK family antitoxin [Algibacter lectus]|uniref:Phophatidylinositol-4-phosphate 5-kinase n=1 Tax=Algibacter lectus TaxID=221126 RepID=A0A4R8M758_9FLAO|nr:hypothetical protein [Algibacter lectus]MWW25741.1 hypothetical protein [Algibacter lectus]TDY61024.1 hypothetical protein DFQ06_3033 [Algibacter lectus]